MKALVNCPISHLMQYRLLIESLPKKTPTEAQDWLRILQLLGLIDALEKETKPRVASAEQKVEVWRYNSNLVFKPGEQVVRALAAAKRLGRC
jgi:hypothetical protein